jgi:hypothetical protein
MKEDKENTDYDDDSLERMHFSLLPFLINVFFLFLLD